MRGARSWLQRILLLCGLTMAVVVAGAGAVGAGFEISCCRCEECDVGPGVCFQSTASDTNCTQECENSAAVCNFSGTSTEGACTTQTPLCSDVAPIAPIDHAAPVFSGPVLAGLVGLVALLGAWRQLRERRSH